MARVYVSHTPCRLHPRNGLRVAYALSSNSDGGDGMLVYRLPASRTGVRWQIGFYALGMVQALTAGLGAGLLAVERGRGVAFIGWSLVAVCGAAGVVSTWLAWSAWYLERHPEVLSDD